MDAGNMADLIIHNPETGQIELPEGVNLDDVIIKCIGLTKIFRDFWFRNRVRAVDGIDLEIYRGEVFGLLGPNGSGKSTTIKLLLGLLYPTAGRIAVFARHPRDVSIKQQIGYLPEESYLYRFLNARETLDYYGRLFHQPRRQRQKRIDMLLEMVGLERVARRPIGEYSKGMQRRIGLAQALINDPQLLILDEPTTGMDPIGTRQIKDLILELAQRGKTILLCSHLLADVEDVCSRVAVMFGGTLRKQGTVDQLLVQGDLTTIYAESLSTDDISAIEQLLESRGKYIARTERPRQKLETLFLDIVHEAQSQGLQTSGAQAGGRLAQFLIEDEERGAHMPEIASAKSVIDQLVNNASDASQTPETSTTDKLSHTVKPQDAPTAPEITAEQQIPVIELPHAAGDPDKRLKRIDELLARLDRFGQPADDSMKPGSPSESATDDRQQETGNGRKPYPTADDSAIDPESHTTPQADDWEPLPEPPEPVDYKADGQPESLTQDVNASQPSEQTQTDQTNQPDSPSAATGEQIDRNILESLIKSDEPGDGNDVLWRIDHASDEETKDNDHV